jgi:hypothetical protein
MVKPRSTKTAQATPVDDGMDIDVADTSKETEAVQKKTRKTKGKVCFLY